MPNVANRSLDVGAELIKFETAKLAISSDFDSLRNVILIHGFTADGKNMEPLANYLNGNGFNSFIYNYNSYVGIHAPANILLSLLTDLDQLSGGALKETKIALVGHSMGGLVSRALTRIEGADQFVSKVVTLGTPHDATVKNEELLQPLIRWGEFISTAMPEFTKKSCGSLIELTGNDSVIDQLQSNNQTAHGIPILSVSGAKDTLDYTKNPVVNAVIRRRILKLFGSETNDGLVMEKSSDITRVLSDDVVGSCSHLNNYPEYYKINHSNIVSSQSLTLKILSWLSSRTTESAV